jgi:hypothetical protein
MADYRLTNKLEGFGHRFGNLPRHYDRPFVDLYFELPYIWNLHMNR